MEPTEDQEVDLYSDQGATSLRRLLSNCPKTVAALDAIPLELLEKTEFELLRRPDDVQHRLKISFWNEYRRCQRQGLHNMVLANVINGVCGMWYWQKRVISDLAILAWVLTPPTAEMLVWQELLELGQRKLRRVLKLPLVEKRYWKDKTGEIHIEKRTNVALVREVRAIVENLQNRLHGSVVQRQQIHSLVEKAGESGAKQQSIQDEMAQIKQLLGKIERVAGAVPELEAGVIIEGVIPEDPEP